MVGMEVGSPDIEAKVKELEHRFASHFDEMLYTVHELQTGEVPGTCSNHFCTQVAAELHFDDATNVIFTKFDCNMRIAGPLLQEMESVWTTIEEAERRACSFYPVLCWSHDRPDTERTLVEIMTSVTVMSFSNFAPFVMAYVSGSLQGVIQEGFTPPGLLAEDELTYAKKAILFPGASSYRLSAMILKIFNYPQVDDNGDAPPNPSLLNGSDSEIVLRKGKKEKISSVVFFKDVFVPRFQRWALGSVETIAYVLEWLFDMVPNHPKIKQRCQTWLFLLELLYRQYVLSMLLSTPVVIYVNRMHDTENSFSDFIGAFKVVSQTLAPALILMCASEICSVQWRQYHNFSDLSFNSSKIQIVLYAVCAMFFLVGEPLVVTFIIVWTYLKHGVQNRPGTHTVQKSGSDHMELRPLEKEQSVPLL
jgi:hypothetical protein